MHRYFVGAGVIALTVMVGVIAARVVPGDNNDLAAVLALEAKLVEDWQNKGGLKKDLAVGSRGKDVTMLQSALRLQDSNMQVTGYFGSMTKAAVTKFQAKNNLSETGVVNESTRAKINEIYFNELCPQDAGPTAVSSKITLVDKQHPLPENYVPSGLVYVSHKIKSFGVTCLQHEAAEALVGMFDAAAKEGLSLGVTSGFRRPEIQGLLFDFWQKRDGAKSFDEVALPRYSEHQLGTTVDLTGTSVSNSRVADGFAFTPEKEWLDTHAVKYGFVMSYPPNKQHITGYVYEPWHWRYVGVDMAEKVATSGLTLTEYLRSLR